MGRDAERTGRVAELALTGAAPAVVTVVLVDVFYTIHHPSGQGALAAGVVDGVAGGLALACWPATDGGLAPRGWTGERGGVLEAVHVSAVVMTTLGFGDVVPGTAGLRLPAPAEALIGFVLLTAPVS